MRTKVVLGISVWILAFLLGGTCNAATDVFKETWESGIKTIRWNSWGSPAPKTVPGEGLDDGVALNPNGDGWCQSGLTTKQTFQVRKGYRVGGWINANFGNNPWQNVQFYLTTSSYTEIGEEFWGAGMIGIRRYSDSTARLVEFYVGSEIFQQDSSANEGFYQYYYFIINDDNTVSFYIDNNLAWTSSTVIDLSAYSSASLSITGAAETSPMYIDNVSIDVVCEPVTVRSGSVEFVTEAGYVIGNTLLTHCGAAMDSGRIRLTHEAGRGTCVRSTSAYGLGVFTAEVFIPNKPGLLFSFYLYKEILNKENEIEVYETDFEFIPNNYALHVGTYNKWVKGRDPYEILLPVRDKADPKIVNYWDSFWHTLKIVKKSDIIELYIDNEWVWSTNRVVPVVPQNIMFNIWSPTEGEFPYPGTAPSSPVNYFVRNVRFSPFSNPGIQILLSVD